MLNIFNYIIPKRERVDLKIESSMDNVMTNSKFRLATSFPNCFLYTDPNASTISLVSHVTSLRLGLFAPNKLNKRLTALNILPAAALGNPRRVSRIAEKTEIYQCYSENCYLISGSDFWLNTD